MKEKINPEKLKKIEAFKVKIAEGKVKKYQILHPHLIGLAERSKKYFLNETAFGYKCFIGENIWFGLPASIVENNPELYLEIIK